MIRVRIACRGTALACALLMAGATSARAGTVALTFDDLPVLGAGIATPEAEAITRRLLAGLRRAHLPATGFVNEGKLEGADKPARVALLVRWLDAGMDLGNHGYAHRSLNDTPVDAYIADIARGEVATRALLAERGRTEHWYRYPYLETGQAAEAKTAVAAWLAEHRYRIAPVTMENADWAFVDLYDAAVLHHDRQAQTHIRREYLDYTARIVAWYRLAAIGLLKRQPAFVFLLHASRLNADMIRPLAAILKAARLRGVTLDQATADPAYATVDGYVGPEGEEWLSRWAATLGKELPWASMPPMPADVEAAAAATTR